MHVAVVAAGVSNDYGALPGRDPSMRGICRKVEGCALPGGDPSMRTVIVCTRYGGPGRQSLVFVPVVATFLLLALLYCPGDTVVGASIAYVVGALPERDPSMRSTCVGLG